MKRGPAWTPPRRRKPRRLGSCEITYHAVDSYQTRGVNVAPEHARSELEAIARDAVRIGRTVSGEEIYAAGRLRLIVHRPARRRPILLTVTTRDEIR